MPTGSLPESGKKLWEEIYNKALKGSCKDDKECAARTAWSAIKGAGWKKDADGKWHKSADLSEFSLRIERASLDKATQERRWRAVASDIDSDSYGDSMSLQLFSDFIQRIDAKERVPEEFRSEFWSGGLPYLSVSHYLDLNGDAVPGPTDAVFVDGRYLKAKGRFNNNPLGNACFDSVCKDLYDEKSKTREDKVRISIAFLDWAHKHKSNGYEFERKSLEDACPECFREFIDHISNGTEIKGKEFLKGHLIHLALTRVPVNKRTSMEVDRSMTTRKEDAASIIGEDLADEIDEKATLVGKSEALVIKSDDLDEPIETTDQPIVEEAKMKKDEEYKCPDGMSEEDCKKQMEKHQMKAEIVEVKPEPDLKAMIKAAMLEMKAEEVAKPVSHILDTVFVEFKAAYDEVAKSELPYEEKLTTLQENFAGMVNMIRDSLKPVQTEAQVVESEKVDMVKALSIALQEAMQPVAQKLDLVITQLSTRQPVVQQSQIPERRSIQPKPYIPNVQPSPQNKSTTPKLRALIEATTK